MIYDLNNNLTPSGNISSISDGVKEMSRMIDCRANYFLKAETSSGIVVEARKHGAGAWVNIATNPINLTADNGQRIRYDFRLTLPTVTAHLRRLIRIKVAP